MNHYSQSFEGVGRFCIQSIRFPEDLAHIYEWVNLPYAEFWGLQGKSKQQVIEEYSNIIESGIQVFIGWLDNEPQFLIEVYDPKKDPLSKHYNVLDGDVGLHILVAPPKKSVHHFTLFVLCSVLEFLFSHFKALRVVIEPDHRNEKMHKLSVRVGFSFDKVIYLEHKKSFLGFCYREAFYQQLSKENLL
ncbi:GNAT family N-acetyltransferase [Shewanella surugensis]|uniref:Acetyltransferase n=1 Tax=Shewanella surugensis TaxID=212020 RepID=A0ABT0LCL3_9GAMM|nr:GNAT family N-acetyltransferase [Shewanella surugensis]MCL1125414.1 acetyltransferase [Shewanella surugensis]